MADEEEGRKKRCKAAVVATWKEIVWVDAAKAFLAEFIGCFLIAFIGCGAAISADNWGHTLTGHEPETFSYGDVYQTVTALAFGLAVMVTVAIFQTVSGAHMNPAVSLAHIIAKRANGIVATLYMFPQIGGFFAGCAFLLLVRADMNDRDDLFPTLLLTEHGMVEWQGIIWEVVLGFHLVLVYLVVNDDATPFYRYMSPLYIGLSVTLNHLAALYATGGTANPARTLAAGILSDKEHAMWVYAIGPQLGAVLGALFHKFVLQHEAHEDED